MQMIIKNSFLLVHNKTNEDWKVKDIPKESHTTVRASFNNELNITFFAGRIWRIGRSVDYKQGTIFIMLGVKHIFENTEAF